MVALIGEDELESQSLDSAILIRTAHISESGEVRIPVWSTIVRHSNPAQEAAETVAKARGLLAAFTSANSPQLETTTPFGARWRKETGASRNSGSLPDRETPSMAMTVV
ncbi:chorismate-binding protein [Rhizobium laguerreae]|uniref:Chorismate binding enzyme n=1 Tax=Rhizobium laguerreae TaxID=1076926 RepID=A0AAX2QAI2_9HYPH|nr:chorismate-binding protein [Rhizobium laguerreae]TCU12728.1 chorismate binding enzyme [Rhizobium laguerreae]